ncbi:sulfotransferase [Paracoccus sp. PS-1]|uniref:sulfotransferase n=1 Tax=unclassified Paracoccus (in: a-proteobacteria) TaxID=2688777 RepID=UPI00049142D6|nr:MULTISPECIES: sulfotransferase [unclassified Paracoccus (in: a-proteobacteria)]MDQ7262059.1 sulfotransferase [Paracoccus sp. PS1]
MRGALILGSARCGSTLVSQILNAHPAVLSVSELFAAAGHNAFRPAHLDGARFWAQMATPSRAMSQVANPDAAPSEFLYGRVPQPAHDPWHCPPILAVALPHLSRDPDALFAALAAQMRRRPQAPLAAHYRALFQAMAQQIGGRRIWAERSGGSLVAAATLRGMFPDAALVLLTRSGPETALSMRDYPAARLAIWCWRRLGPLGLDLLHPRRHFGRGALWPLVAAVGGRSGVRRIVSQRPGLAETGAFWSAVMVRGLRGLQGARPLILRYEDLCREPGIWIERLGLHLDAGAPAAWLDRTAGMPQQRPSRLAALSADERHELERACAPGEAALAAYASGLSAGAARLQG